MPHSFLSAKADIRPRATRRRIHSLILVFVALVFAAPATPAQTPTPSGGKMTPVRPPATPLIVRQPYVSVWQPADALPGHWPAFWTGAPRSMTGIARIDGTPYVFLGAPENVGSPMTQTSLTVTPTQSRYELQAGGVTVSLNFLSPVEPDDLRRQSVPFGYILAGARSADGRPHAVSLYFDISGQWAHNDEKTLITWRSDKITGGKEPLTAFTVEPAEPRVLGENRDYPTWGQAVFATASGPGVTAQAGPEADVRAAAATQGRLDNSVDQNRPRAINDRSPVFGFNFDLGRIGKRAGKPVVLALGQVRDPSVSYLGQPAPPLWRSYWPDWPQMLSFFYDDADNALKTADRLDRRVTADATRAGGPKYAALCALALRQAFGATELVGTSERPWMFMKEISSDGNISTVDVVYPAFPVFLYANPYLLRLQLDPLLAYAETGGWPKPFAEHDIGASYPNAAGHNDGREEDMPVEESANMLIMAAAYLRYAPKADAQAYAKQHYKILKQWADYEVENGLDPASQNQTDDFTGFIAHSVNLALKGILGVGAMGQIAGYAGNKDDAARYTAASRDMIAKWAQIAQSKTGPHLTLQYVEPDTAQTSAWTRGIVGPHALRLRGAGDAEVPAPVVDTTRSYTVAAWVRPGSTNGFQTFVSIDGSKISGFFLGLRGGTGRFALSAPARDDAEPGQLSSANSNDAAAAGTWYHLAGVYDADAGTLSLYVNGQLQQTVPCKTVFHAGGHTAIGRGLFGGNPAAFANASIDDVRLYQAALPAADILAVARDGGTALPEAGSAPPSVVQPGPQSPAAYWTFDEGTGATAADSSGGGHTATLQGVSLDPNNAWSLKYNAFPDKVLGLDLVPQSVLQEEAKFYMTRLNEFGVPLDNRHTYTKTDWELWTAASTDDGALRQAFVDAIYKFADTSRFRGAFTDWYDTVSGQQVGFVARPVIGGVFAILDRTALKAGR
ncbi:MAG: DUF4965 domain-containing protein [Armatimonadetes bacterium]|nr:DUF4965 domain-containing protein [Armatimonadota bacterium]